MKDGKVGDKVKVYDSLYKSTDGTGRSTAKRGQTGTIKRVEKSGKRYLVENWGWGHDNDLQKFLQLVQQITIQFLNQNQRLQVRSLTFKDG